MISEQQFDQTTEHLFVLGLRLAAGIKPPDGLDVCPEALEGAVDLAKRRWMFTHVAEGLLTIVEDRQSDWLQAEAKLWKTTVMQANAVLLNRSLMITERLQDHGLKFIFFKGIAQQKQIYDDFFFRPTSDIDILVSKQDFAVAMRVLGEIGFRPKFERSFWWETFLGERHLYLTGHTQRAVDLHKGLQQPGIPGPKDPSAFYSPLSFVEHRGQRWPVVPERVLPLIPAMNLVKGMVAQRKMIPHAWDLSQLLEHGNSARVASFMEVAAQQGLTGTALVSLRILNALFPGPYREMETRLAKTLAGITDDEIVATLVGVRPMAQTLRRRDILMSTCERQIRPMVSELLWYGASELSRRFDREHLESAAAQKATK